ncbi:hypothetical protein CD178_00055 [Komagataeibacter saccharivorans]|uniref:Uncharacterized protein n=1 Tax=Komagataeibacter saccharivorans TaxID=265959 RepID=A0A347W7Q2_9PROT|nr:hypothetical protein CD178_00055 [Komagataeibacter saccharivorans]
MSPRVISIIFRIDFIISFEIWIGFILTSLLSCSICLIFGRRITRIMS